MNERTYIAIDLKSFYASVECVERDLDPLEVNLAVADVTRTEKTICRDGIEVRVENFREVRPTSVN